MHFMDVKYPTEIFLVLRLFCAYSCLKDRAFTAVKRDAKLP